MYVGVCLWGRVVGQNLKKGIGNIGGLHKIEGLGTLYQLWIDIVMFFHSNGGKIFRAEEVQF